MDTNIGLEILSFLSSSSSAQVLQSSENKKKKIYDLFHNKKLPEDGWDEAEIEYLLQMISFMDSNNFEGNAGVGERESRFASNLVAKRHFRMGHGIGRSGDLLEIQPKAAGSSAINKLTNELVLEILKLAGAETTKKCFIAPMATGMSIVLCLRALHKSRPKAKYVIWSRIDQKSCFKSILTAGFEPIIVDGIQHENQLQLTTNIQKIISEIKCKCNCECKCECKCEFKCNCKAESIACVLTTTSCFAPRAADNVVEVGEICRKYNIPHIINNAYGIQCREYMSAIDAAGSRFRVDAYVSSTDKNFMVPVGGSVIAGYNESFIQEISQMYPGRASAVPTVDIFITLLHLGKKGYNKLLDERKKMFEYLKFKMTEVAKTCGTKVLDVPGNEISIGFDLSMFDCLDNNVITEIGSMLFSKSVSGTRVVTPGVTKNIGGFEFHNWGAHSDSWNTSYLTAAATLGIEKKDINLFTKRLKDVLVKVKKHAAHLKM